MSEQQLAPHLKFIEVLKENDDYDAIEKKHAEFGFAVLAKEFDDISENKYEKIELESCKVNVYALKKVIRMNLESLREIYLKDCSFYLSDKFAKQTSNLRMLQEINFVWLIETLKFVNIEVIDLQLLKEQFGNKRHQRQQKSQTAKKTPFINKKSLKFLVNDAQQSQGERTEKESTVHILNKRKDLKQTFKCEDDCQFLRFEQIDKHTTELLLKDEKLKVFAESLIWDRVQNLDDFWDKLYENIISDIQQNLAIYKKFSKFAFDGIKLMVIGDVLNNGISVAQLYNIIHMNCTKIQGIIFKDTGRIRAAAFRDLMTQLFLIPQLESLAFLSSVLEEGCIYELQYLIVQKQVKYLVLNQSFFTKDDFEELLNTKAIDVNHSRFSIIDVLSKKLHEFCPYSFNMEEALKKKDEDLLAIERLYVFQKHYPKQIQREINFYQARNVSIISTKTTERIMFKHWDISSLTDEETAALYPNQEELTKILDQILLEDNINILNYGIVKMLINLVEEVESKEEFAELLSSQKSFKNLCQSVPEEVAANVTYSTLSHLKLCHSYLLGFTRFKSLSMDLIIDNEAFFENLYKPKEMAKLLKNSGSSIIANSLSGFEKDKESNEEFIEKIKPVITLADLQCLTINGIHPKDGNHSYLNEIFKECINLKEINLMSLLMYDASIKDVNFSLLSEHIEAFNIMQNPSLQNLSFIDLVFKRCKKLKRINFYDVEMDDKKARTIDFSKMPDSVEEIILSFNMITDATTLNNILKFAPKIKMLKAIEVAFTTNVLLNVNFPPSLLYLDIRQNYNVDCFKFLLHLGQKEGLLLEKFKFYDGIEFPKQLSSDQERFLVAGSLPGLKNLKRFNVGKVKIVCPKLLRIFIVNMPNLEGLSIDINMDTLAGTGLDDTPHPLLKRLVFLSIDIEEGKQFDFSSLSAVLRNSPGLRIFDWMHSKIPFGELEIRDIPIGLEELAFEGNDVKQSLAYLNLFFSKCSRLKYLDLSFCKLNKEKLQEVDFTLISENLEELNIDCNDELEDYDFLNIILRKCRKLKKISLQGMRVKESAKNIDFSLAGPSFVEVVFDMVDAMAVVNSDEEPESASANESNNYFTLEFIDWMMNRSSFVVGLYDFEVKHVHKLFDDGHDINFFDIFEQHNIYQQISSMGRYIKSQDRGQQQIQQIQQNKGLIEFENDTEVEIPSVLDGEELTKNQTTAIRNASMKLKVIHNLATKNPYLPFSNSSYFYTFFKEFGQLSIIQNGGGNMSEIMETLKVIEFQNVFIDVDYQLLTVLSRQQERAKNLAAMERYADKPIAPSRYKPQLMKFDEDYDQTVFLSYLNELILTETIFTNLDFLQFFLDKCPNLILLDFSDSNLSAPSLKNIKVANMPNVIEVNFMENSFEKSDLSVFINTILSSCPNLQKLNLSDMKIGQFSKLNLTNVNPFLEELDVSKNKDFPLKNCLAGVLARCQNLKKLTISRINLTKSSALEGFQSIARDLLEFDMSYNPLIETIQLLNIVVKRCQKLRVLNISKCKIEEDQFNKIEFNSISPDLEEFDTSGNAINSDYNFIGDLILRCGKFRKLDFSGQVIFKDVHPKFNRWTFTSNVIEEINVGKNVGIQSFEFVARIIETSKCFKKLIVQKDSLFLNVISSFRFKDIAKYIEEFDMQHQRSASGLSQLWSLKESTNFKYFNASNSIISQEFFSQIDIFKNILTLEIEKCSYILDVAFLNKLFEVAKSLEVLNLSSCPAGQKSFNQVDFKKTPKTLRKFIMNSVLLEDFSFISDILEATQTSLRVLSLEDCMLTNEKLNKIDFSKAGFSLAEINLVQNFDIDSLEALRKLFREDYHLQLLSLSRANFEMLEFLGEFQQQIYIIRFPTYTVQFKFFTQSTQFIEINLVCLLRFLQGASTKGLPTNSSSNNQRKEENVQKLWRSNSEKGFVFKNLIKSIVEFRSENKSTMMIEHFLFALLTEQYVPKQPLSPNFFIMSPYSFFQQANTFKGVKQFSLNQTLTNIKGSSQNYKSQSKYQDEVVDESLEIQQQPSASLSSSQRSKEVVSPDHTFNADAYHLAMKNFEMLKNNNYKYIFGFSRFFLKEFPSFYQQNLSEDLKDIEFMLNISSMMHENKIQRAFLPLRLTLTNDVLDTNNINEFDVLLLVTDIPPAVVNLRGMSIQFVKSWYALNFSSPLSVNTTIQVDYELIENSSIANFLALRTFRMYIRNFEPKSLKSSLKKIIGQIGYSFFSIFSAPPAKYQFDHTVIHLENRIKLAVSKNHHHILSAIYPIQLFICIFSAFYYQLKDNIACGSTMPDGTYITYGVFGAVTFILEAYVFQIVLTYVSHLIPDIKTDCRVTFPSPLINRIKIAIMDIQWINRWYINYVLSFVNSQLSRFDFLTNLGFLYSTYACNETVLFYCTLASLVVVNLMNIILFINTFYQEKKQGRMITRQIDRLYQVSSLLGFQSVAEIVDIISPTNSVILFKKMFNQRIVQNFIRIIFQDMPLIIIKALFLARTSGDSNSSIYPIISSSLMFLSSMSKFLSITPSLLGQEDFNKLSEIKKKNVLPVYQENLAMLEGKIAAYNFFQSSKSLKSDQYHSDVLKDNKESVGVINPSEIEVFHYLRRFENNKQSINGLFGISSSSTEIPDVKRNTNVQLPLLQLSNQYAPSSNFVENDEYNKLLYQNENKTPSKENINSPFSKIVIPNLEIHPTQFENSRI